MFDSVWNNFRSGNHANVSNGKSIKDAMEKMKLALYIDKKTLRFVFFETECAETRRGVEIGFENVNHYLRFLLRVQPANERYGTVCGELETVKTSEKFTAHLKRSSSLEEALQSWKTDVVQDLSFQIEKYREEDRNRNKWDRELLQRYLPETSLAMEREVNDEEIQKQYRKSSKRSTRMEDSESYTKTKKKARQSNHVGIRREKVCIHYKEGKCKRGQSCKYEHII